MKKYQWFLLTTIILVAFVLRLYKIDSPIADWHSWRQADTASVTRTYAQQGIDLLHPRYHDLSRIPSGKENPHGYRMVEFPIYNILHLGVHTVLPGISLEIAGRLTTVIGSLLSLILLFFITKRISGTTVAFIAATVFSLLPYNIYYSRVILPDPWMVTFSLGAVYFFYKWIDSQSNVKLTVKLSPAFFLAFLCTAAALLIKPTAIFTVGLLPIIAFSKWKFESFKIPHLYIFGALAIVPLLGWRLWIQQFPSGIPNSVWLYNASKIRFRPAWFRWLFYERITNLILGGFGTVFLATGLSKLKSSTEIIYLIWGGLFLVYFSIFATGNVTHDYYQIPLIPLVSILVAKGIYQFWTNPGFNRLISIPLSLGISGMALFISFYEVKGYYQINNNSIVIAGEAADQILPLDAKVIAPYAEDTAFLYQINRSGWPKVTDDISKMIKLGATHYVSVNYDEQTNQVMQQYQVIKAETEYVIVDLTKPIL